MKLTRLSLLSITGCLAALALMVIVTIVSAYQMRDNHDTIEELQALRERVNELSVASDSLVMFGADPALLQAYLQEATAIHRILEEFEDQRPEARRAAHRVEAMAAMVESAVHGQRSQPDGSEDPPPAVPARFRIVQQRVADQGIALDTTLNNLLRERQSRLHQEARWVMVVLAAGTLLFGALCIVAFGLVHGRIARPAQSIADALQRVRSGDQAARADIDGDDELSGHAETLNRALDERDAADADLRQREERLRQFQELVEGSEDLCGIVDDSYHFLWVNQAYADHYRLDRDRIRELTLGEVLGEAYFEEVVRPRVDRVLGGESQRFETTRDLPGQPKRRLLARYYPIDVPGRKSRHVGAVITDVTEVRRAEAEIARQGRLLDMAGRAARLGAWSVDLESKRIEWSDMVAEIHAKPPGYAPTLEEALSFYPREHRERIAALFSACAEHGQAYDEELQIIDANRQPRWVRTVGEAVRDEAGNITRVQGAFQDISRQKSLESESRQMAGRLAAMLESITDGFVAFDHDWRYTWINAEAEHMLDKSSDELIGTTVWSQFPDLAGTQTERALIDAMEGRVSTLAEEYFEPLGAWFEVRVYPWEGGVAAFFRDVTDNRRMLEQLQAQEAALRVSRDELDSVLHTRQALINSLPAHIAMLDADGVIVDVNDRWRQFAQRNNFSGSDFGGSDFGVGQSYVRVCEAASEEPGDTADLVARGLREVLAGHRQSFALEYPCHSPDEECWFRATFDRLATGDAGSTGGAVAMHIDITERKRAEQEINRLAYEDPLTETLSRNGLILALDGRLQGDAWAAHGFVAMLDVVGQHDINDAHGYGIGDKLLIALARRLQELATGEGLAGRTGGDEFVVYCPAPDEHARDRILEAMEHLHETPFRFEDGRVAIEVGVAIGYTVLGRERRSASALIRETEMALFEQRRQAGDRVQRVAFTQDLEQRTHERVELTRELRRALENDEFEFHFQPKVDLADGRMISAEALIRWQHPERGLVPPGLFIPVAEQSQLIGPIGDWAVRAACRHLSEWRAANLDVVRISVNVSQIQFLLGDFPAKVRAALDEFGIEPQHLSLEITESVFERHSDRLLAEIQELHELGVQLSLDDFGTGYSSLLYLQRYPFDEIKIDRGFVDRLLHDEFSRDVVLAVMDLSRALNAGVVAEGIESREIAGALLEMGCTVGQGYYYSMPLAAEDFRWLLEKRSSLPLGPGERGP